ncbi:hypothetical protein EBT31_02835 [bacterium]|nr:hypothetical protein [bacterium]NBX48502.1 hypothetical protein [bacterium]
MSSAGWLKIAAEGIQDTYIHGKPDVSYFTTLYKSHTPFLLNTFEIPFNNPPLASGGNAVCRIPYKGDLLRGLGLKVTLPSVYTPGPGWIKTLRYAPSLMFNFTDGTNVIINAQQTTSNIFKTYNEISNIYMSVSNLVGTVSNGMYVYGTPYTGLVNVADQSDTQYILANLVTSQYTEPITTLTHVYFANCIANAITTNITNSNLSPVTSLYGTPVAGMNVYSTDYTGAVNVAAVVSHGSNLFNLYLNLTAQQPRSFNKTIYLSNITTTYSTSPVSNLMFTFTDNAFSLSDNMRVYNSPFTGVVTANIYTANTGMLVFTSQQPASLVSNGLVFEASANLSTANIESTQFVITSSFPTLVSNSIFPGMNIYFSNTAFRVTTPPNVVSISDTLLTANVLSTQPISESGTLFVSNITAVINVANVTSQLFEFVGGPYGGLTYGNVFGLSFQSNVNTLYPSSILLNCPDQQPVSVPTTNVMFFTTTSNLSTVAITTSNIAFFSPTGPPAVNDTIVFASGGFTGTTTVTSIAGYPSDVTVSVTSQQPKSFSNLSVTYAGKSATVSTLNITRQTMYVSNLTGPDPTSVMYTNITGTTNLSGFLLPYFGAVQNVISYSNPNLIISFPSQQPVSFQNNFTRYAFSGAQLRTANITQAVYKYSTPTGNIAASVGQYVSNASISSHDYITGVNTSAQTLTVSFPSRQPFVKNNFLCYISPYSNISYITSPISNCILNYSNNYGYLGAQSFVVIPSLGPFSPSNISSSSMTVSFTPLQPFSFTNAFTVVQSSLARVTTNTISNASVTFGTSSFTNDSSVINTSNTLIGSISNKSGSGALLTFPQPIQPYSATTTPVYIGLSANAQTNLISYANITISNQLGPGTIQVTANVLGLGYSAATTSVSSIISPTSLKLELNPPQQPASFSNLVYFSNAFADFTSPSSIPWLVFSKSTAQQVSVFYNPVTKKWNFKSLSKPIANLAFASYENMVFWGFDPHNRS